MAKSNPRRANGSRRNALRRWLAQFGYPCALCGRPIDYSLPARHPMSYEVDEVVPVSRFWDTGWNRQQGCPCGGYPSAEAAALAKENVQAAHRICNQRKGNGLKASGGRAAAIARTREWL